MAKKSKPQQKPAVKGTDKPQPSKQNGIHAAWYKDRTQLLIIGLILLLTFIAFSPALTKEKEFLNWDDDVYILNQQFITGLDGVHLHAIFTEPVSLNYHPLTMLSLAINYHFSGLSPFGYVFTNIFIHLLNTLLVFIFLFRLSGRKFWIGAFAAMIFGLHPMHVESVAWVSERKDVLYCFFFLASCIFYLGWIESKKWLYLVLCFLVFLLSCLSKAMAAPLPLVLLLIDFYRQRKFTFTSIAEKIPFLAVSLWIGLKAVAIQSQGAAIADFRAITVPQHFIFASYSFIMYWLKFFVPFSLSAFYPYPDFDNQGNLPAFYFILPLLALALIIAPILYSYKRSKENFRLLIFCMGFFILMLAMVLQFISVGSTIMSDRYTYLPYVGAAFLLASLLNPHFENAKTKMVALGASGVVSVILLVLSYSRVQVWQDSNTLWSDVIEKYPYVFEEKGGEIKVIKKGIDAAYENRGYYWIKHGDVNRSLPDYDVLIKAQTKSYNAWNGVGSAAFEKGEYEKALKLYGHALTLSPSNPVAHENLAVAYDKLGRHKEAVDEYAAAMKIRETDHALSMNSILALEKVQLGQWADCIAVCNRLLLTSPENGDLYYYRGTAEFNTAKYDDAIRDLSQAAKYKPGDGNIWFNLSYAYNQVGNKAQALEAAMNAESKGFKMNEAYMQKLKGN